MNIKITKNANIFDKQAIINKFNSLNWKPATPDAPFSQGEAIKTIISEHNLQKKIYEVCYFGGCLKSKNNYEEEDNGYALYAFSQLYKNGKNKIMIADNGLTVFVVCSKFETKGDKMTILLICAGLAYILAKIIEKVLNY